MRALVIEDNPKMARGIQSGLQEAGFATEVSHSGFEGEDLAAGQQFDIIVLDLMLPDRDGVEICRNLRRRKIATPIIMLTALDTTQDKVQGLDAGADDYLAKPFNPLELTARIRAILKRAPPREGGTATRNELASGRLRLDLKRFELLADGQPIALTPAEMRVIEVLMRRQGEVLSRGELTEFALQRRLEPYDRSIDTIMSKLRRKLADAGIDNPRIRGVRSHGYVLDVAEGAT